MSKINVIAAGIEVALDKGLKPDECYAILKNSGYSDEELHQAFLKVAAIDRSKSTKTGLE